MAELHYSGHIFTIDDSIIKRYKRLWFILGPYWELFPKYIESEYAEKFEIAATHMSDEEMSNVITRRLTEDVDVNMYHSDCFLGNIRKVERRHMEAIAKTLDATITFYDSPLNMATMEPMPDMYRVECSPEDYAKENNIMGLFFDAGIRLSRKYGERLRNLGFPIDELPYGKNIYLGCENEYWPDLVAQFKDEGKI